METQANTQEIPEHVSNTDPALKLKPAVDEVSLPVPKALVELKAEPLQRPQLAFSTALEAAKAGARIGRAGWNGKGMWVCLGQGHPALPAASFWNKHTRLFAEFNGGSAEVLPYLILKTADNKILMGWLASQTDMLANDWEILPE